MQQLLRTTLVAFVGLVALNLGTQARADLFMRIIVDGTQIVPDILDDADPLDANPEAGVITIDVQALNATLAGMGLSVAFDSLDASSNRLDGVAGSIDVANLTQTGSVRYTSTSGASSIEILASDHDYLFPDPAPLMNTSASATFTNANATTQMTFQSGFDQGNSHFTFSPAGDLLTLTPNLLMNPSSDSEDANPTLVGGIPPYALSNHTILDIGPSPSGTAEAKIGWSGSTTVVPEPASMALVLVGLASAGLFHRKLRRRAA